MSCVGSKFEILDRIANTLDKKIEKNPSQAKSNKPESKFVWSKSKLTLETKITDSYTNRPNSRTFFKEHCGKKFHFSIPFMYFMKHNIGKTLNDAVIEWKKLNELTKDKKHKSKIPEGNQYNQYIRDFYEDNPNLSLIEARHFWKLKKELPLGKHIYEKSDLQLEH